MFRNGDIVLYFRYLKVVINKKLGGVGKVANDKWWCQTVVMDF